MTLSTQLRCGWSFTAIALLAAMGLWATAAWAVTFPNLYTVTVRPDPAARDQRAEAVRLGMASLLERITGRTDAGTDPELSQLMNNANNYVNSYGLLDRERAQVGFISSAVEGALTAANWPVWGAERPLTLVWLAVDGGNGERGLLSSTFNPTEWSPEMAALMQSLDEELKLAADQRGLPITLPLLDLEDLQTVGFADVWGGFDLPVELASRRYGVDAHLIAQVRASVFGLDIRWTLVQGERRRIVLSNAISDGLDWVAEQYAAEFSIVGGMRTLRITVRDVATLADYGRVMNYLESLSLLANVDVEGFEGSDLNLRVAARSDETVLRRVLALGGVLVPPPPTAFLQAPVNTLIFDVAQSNRSR